MPPLGLPKKGIQGGGFTHVHIPLEDPPLRWGIIWGWCGSSQDGCRYGGRVLFCDMVVAYWVCAVMEVGWCVLLIWYSPDVP